MGYKYKLNVSNEYIHFKSECIRMSEESRGVISKLKFSKYIDESIPMFRCDFTSLTNKNSIGYISRQFIDKANTTFSHNIAFETTITCWEDISVENDPISCLDGRKIDLLSPFSVKETLIDVFYYFNS